mmetsp:Transcript_2738/g.7554  ORF Transcript_2738/g.7554 Transcript_2738/m.7554 type:complete len:210 (+) Transcript_2738:1603-2232(+)
MSGNLSSSNWSTDVRCGSLEMGTSTAQCPFVLDGTLRSSNGRKALRNCQLYLPVQSRKMTVTVGPFSSNGWSTTDRMVCSARRKQRRNCLGSSTMTPSFSALIAMSCRSSSSDTSEETDVAPARSDGNTPMRFSSVTSSSLAARVIFLEDVTTGATTISFFSFSFFDLSFFDFFDSGSTSVTVFCFGPNNPMETASRTIFIRSGYSTIH